MLSRKELADARDRILFGTGVEDAKYSGGIRSFGYASPEMIEELGLGNLPIVREFVDNYPNARISFNGYVVHPSRDDCRTEIKGVTLMADFSSRELCSLSNTYRGECRLDMQPYRVQIAFW